MKLLVATSHGLLEVTENSTKEIENKFAEYYGITWNAKNVYIFGRNSFANKGKLAKIRVFHRSFVHKFTIDARNCWGGHQMYCFNNRIYVCCTAHRHISVYQNDKFIKKVPWKDWNKITKFKCNHINSIWSNGKYLFIIAHNNGPSDILKTDFNFNILDHYKVGREIHNIYVHNTVALFNSSRQSLLVEYDLETRKLVRKVSTKLDGQAIYNRGLAVTKDYIVVGLSMHGDRHGRRRKSGYSVILVFDNNFKLLQKIKLKQYPQIYEIRSIEDLDLAHNSIPW
jgi:hypothetical protein